MFSARYSLPRRGVYAQAMIPSVDLADLLAGQFFPRDYRRFDLMVRARLARAWLSGSPDATAAESAYLEMQLARGASTDLSRFHDLVESVAGSGMNPDFPVGLSPWGPLLDGAHRVAVALAVGESQIAVDVRNSPTPPDYSRQWCVDTGLTEDMLTPADALLDEFLATTGHDTILVINGELTESIRQRLGPGLEVVATRRSVGDASVVSDLETALTHVSWHEHAKRGQTEEGVLRPGPVTIVRARLARPSFERVPKTHTRLSVLARSIQDQVREVCPQAVIGLSRAQNREAVRLLAGHMVVVWGPDNAD